MWRYPMSRKRLFERLGRSRRRRCHLTHQKCRKTMVLIAERLVPRGNVPTLAKINQPRLEARQMDGYDSNVWAYICNRHVSVLAVATATPVWHVPVTRATCPINSLTANERLVRSERRRCLFWDTRPMEGARWDGNDWGRAGIKILEK